MQAIPKTQFKRALAARNKLEAKGAAGKSTGARVDATRRPTQKTLRLAAQSRYQAAKYLADGDGFFGRRVVLLDEPYFHMATWGPHLGGHQDILVDSAVAPGNSWVKVKVDDDGWVTQGVRVIDTLTFWYVWTNATDNTTVVDVSAYMTLSGSWEARADIWEKTVPVNPDPNHPSRGPWQTTSEYGSSTMRLSAKLALYQWWTQPPTLAPLQNVPDQQTQISLLDMALNAYPQGALKSGFLFNFFELKQHLLVIPPEGTLVAEVSFDIDHRVDHGRALANFAAGSGNQVTSHWVQIAYVVAPPLTITPVAVPPPVKNP